MAYKYDTDRETKKELGMFDKNDRGEKVAVTLVTYKDKDKGVAIDIRNMYTDDTKTVRPTQKGVRLSSELMTDVIKLCFKELPEECQDDIISNIMSSNCDK